MVTHPLVVHVLAVGARYVVGRVGDAGLAVPPRDSPGPSGPVTPVLEIAVLDVVLEHVGQDGQHNQQDQAQQDPELDVDPLLQEAGLVVAPVAGSRRRGRRGGPRGRRHGGL